MNEWIEFIVTTLVAVCVFTTTYKIAPFKTWKDNKPQFVFFPKYIAKFESSLETIESTLLALGFSKPIDGKFSRGKAYGDFSVKSIKLSVIIDKPNHQIKVYASFFGILFDTGDVWQLTSEIISNAKR